MVLDRAGDFDLIHGHVDRWNLELARRTHVPVVSTFHGRLDVPWSRAAFAERPPGLVAISEDQARVHPEADWTVIYHGLTFPQPPNVEYPGDDLAFVGRITPEKGVMDAIEVARLTGRRLQVAAKVPTLATEVDYWKRIVKPALAGADVTILGELPEAERDSLVASSHAAIIPSAWPEPFGLVVIEAMALGTPVLVRRSGAIPELVRDGVDGFIGDDARAARLLRWRDRRPGPRRDPAIGSRAIRRDPDGRRVRGPVPADDRGLRT